MCSGRDFIDVTALEVFGAVPNTLPSGSLRRDAGGRRARPGRDVRRVVVHAIPTRRSPATTGTSTATARSTARRRRRPRRSPTRRRARSPRGRGEGLPRRRGRPASTTVTVTRRPPAGARTRRPRCRRSRSPRSGRRALHAPRRLRVALQADRQADRHEAARAQAGRKRRPCEVTRTISSTAAPDHHREALEVRAEGAQAAQAEVGPRPARFIATYGDGRRKAATRTLRVRR